jgi:hypothetical protein
MQRLQDLFILEVCDKCVISVFSFLVSAPFLAYWIYMAAFARKPLYQEAFTPTTLLDYEMHLITSLTLQCCATQTKQHGREGLHIGLLILASDHGKMVFV